MARQKYTISIKGKTYFHLAAKAAQRNTAPLTRPRRFRPGTVALREIRKYQKSTNNIIPRRSFQRLVQEIGREITVSLRFQTTALLALQEAAENYLVSMFNMANEAAIHDKRVTILLRDMFLVKRIRRCSVDNMDNRK